MNKIEKLNGSVVSVSPCFVIFEILGNLFSIPYTEVREFEKGIEYTRMSEWAYKLITDNIDVGVCEDKALSEYFSSSNYNKWNYPVLNNPFLDYFRLKFESFKKRISDRSIVLATKNPGKIKEMKDLLDGYINLEPCDANIMSPIEAGLTFRDNAEIKAVYYYKHHNKPCLADDSGLCVTHLNGEPGVYSARYSEYGDNGNNEKLLEKLKGAPDRTAYYYVSMVLCAPYEYEFFIKKDPYKKVNGYQLFEFTGICYGEIMEEPSGSNGFGYDPIFKPIGYNCSFAELDSDVKNEISHRYKACLEYKNNILFWNAP